MYYYVSTIQYDGSDYAGFQWQNGIKTIQSEFNNAILKIHNGKTTTMAASRTDTGVHAYEQIVKITCENFLDLNNFIEQININLPNDIKCNKIQLSSGAFRPASDTISKEYRYYFTNKTQVPSADRRYISNIANHLNIENIEKCVRMICGVHDFCNFYSSGSNVKSTIRNIFNCEIKLVNPREQLPNPNLFKLPDDLSECFEFKIIANGYLKQMIRHIMSALWMVGSGKLSISEFQKILAGPKINKQLWKVAPPNGLFLYKINYSFIGD